MRPVYHRKDERIRSHVQLCFLALLLMRVAEREVGDTWRNIRHHLTQLHAGTFTGPAGRVVQLTELTTPQRDILRALKVKEPPRFLKITPSQDA